MRIVSVYSGWTPALTSAWVRFVRRRAMSTASAAALAPSYMDAFATGIPNSSLTIVWNSKIACSVPCATSAW